MNDLNPSLHPEFEDEYITSQSLATRMIMKGHSSWELGPLCTRDHAWNLADLKKAVAEFMKTCEEPHGEFVCALMKKDYQRAKQAVYSRLNQKP